LGIGEMPLKLAGFTANLRTETFKFSASALPSKGMSNPFFEIITCLFEK